MRVGQRYLLRTVGSSRARCTTCRCFSDVSSSDGLWQPRRAHHRTHLIFGANTDVGKSVISSGLVRAAASAGCSGLKSPVNYIKPLQCGGSDESFVSLNNDKQDGRDRMNDIHCRTLFSWKTPASPHLVSRWENAPVCDEEVVSKLSAVLREIDNTKNDDTNKNLETASITTIIESAGGVLSPSSSSPLNKTTTADHWGWSTQADLYAPLRIPVVFVGDGLLGGISVTLSSLEALLTRGYHIDAIVFIEGQSDGDSDEYDSIEFGKGNAEALREYMSMQQQLEPSKKVYDDLLQDDDAIVCLPPLPPMPLPLDEWYRSNEGSFLRLHRLLDKKWIVN